MMYASKEDFVADFAKRTKDNCEATVGVPYEVTQLINSMIGLLIIPEQKIYNEITDGMISKDLFESISIGIQEYTYEEEHNLQNIARHIRNAVAHSRLKFDAEKKPIEGMPLEIKSVNFMDGYEDEQKNFICKFKMNISIDMLKKFLYAFADAASKTSVKKGREK